MKCLVFQLASNMASFGGHSMGNCRHSDSLPSKSSILGLLKGLTGIEDLNIELAHKGTIFGGKYNDFHTVKSIKSSTLKAVKKNYKTRKDEVSNSDTSIISKREYIYDSYFLIAINSTKYDLAEIQKLIKNSNKQIWIGRKCCVSSLPLDPIILIGDSIFEIFDEYLSLKGDNIKEFLNVKHEDRFLKIKNSNIFCDEFFLCRDQYKSSKRRDISINIDQKQYDFRKEYEIWR